jgi:hypothetical protein
MCSFGRTQVLRRRAMDLSLATRHRQTIVEKVRYLELMDRKLFVLNFPKGKVFVIFSEDPFPFVVEDLRQTLARFVAL